MKNLARTTGLGACLAFPAAAWAQTSATLPNEGVSWISWAVAVGLAAIVLLTGFLNPKRSHLT